MPTPAIARQFNAVVTGALVLFAPLAGADTDRNGAALFAHHCQACHSRPQGLADAGLPHTTAFLLRMRLRLGLGGMPPFSPRQLSDAELLELVNYVLSSGAGAGDRANGAGADAS